MHMCGKTHSYMWHDSCKPAESWWRRLKGQARQKGNASNELCRWVKWVVSNESNESCQLSHENESNESWKEISHVTCMDVSCHTRYTLHTRTHTRTHARTRAQTSRIAMEEAEETEESRGRENVCVYVCVVCVAWPIYICDMTHAYQQNSEGGGRRGGRVERRKCVYVCMCVCVFRVCDMTHTYVLHDSSTPAE